MNKEFEHWLEKQTYMSRFITKHYTWHNIKRITKLLDYETQLYIKWRVMNES